MAGKSVEGLFGVITHYDEQGRKIGESRPGLMGKYENYDASGKKVGESRPVKMPFGPDHSGKHGW